MNETEHQLRLKRLRYRANHRGIKEMDIILGGFANACLDQLEPALLDAFERLMEEHDQDLLKWFTGEEVFPGGDLLEIFNLVSDHINELRNNV